MKTILTIFLLFVGLTGFTQNLRITGTVYTKEDSLPISGVSVKIKGTNTAVQTDKNGEYTISAPGSYTLVFSLIGYTPQEVKIEKRNIIDVYLPPTTKAEE